MRFETNKKILLRCGRVVTPERLLENVDVVIAAGRIENIETTASETELQRSGELERCHPVSWFIDLHIHGAVGIDTMAASKEDLQRVSQFLAEKGVAAGCQHSCQLRRRLSASSHRDRFVDAAAGKRGGGEWRTCPWRPL